MMEDRRFHRWSPELRRAVMAIRPEFFAWTRDQQERYSIKMPDDDEARLEQVLLAELFGEVHSTPQAAHRAVRDIPLDRLDRWNVVRLPLIGIGEDSFFLNGGLANRKTLLDFPNLRAYDEAQHHYQERVRKNDFPDYEIQPYRGQLYLDHAWLCVDDRFTYGSLSMAAGHIYSCLESLAHDAVKECIPWEYVESGLRLRRDGEYFRMDTRKDAGGQEALVDELTSLTIHHAIARMKVLKEHWHGLGRRGVYIFDPEWEFSASKEKDQAFVFTDVSALDAVRFPSFVRDCNVIARPVQELFQAVAEEEADMRAWVRARHQDLLRTFDPKVVKLRKEPKILFHKEALKDIE